MDSNELQQDTPNPDQSASSKSGPSKDLEDLKVAQEQVLVTLAGQAATDRRRGLNRGARQPGNNMTPQESSSRPIGQPIPLSIDTTMHCIDKPNDEQSPAPSIVTHASSTILERMAEQKAIKHLARGEVVQAQEARPQEPSRATTCSSESPIQPPPPPNSTPIQQPWPRFIGRRPSTDSMFAHGGDTPKSAFPPHSS